MNKKTLIWFIAVACVLLIAVTFIGIASSTRQSEKEKDPPASSETETGIELDITEIYF